jgi:hypothetical protein
MKSIVNQGKLLPDDIVFKVRPPCQPCAAQLPPQGLAGSCRQPPRAPGASLPLSHPTPPHPTPPHPTPPHPTPPHPGAPAEHRRAGGGRRQRLHPGRLPPHQGAGAAAAGRHGRRPGRQPGAARGGAGARPVAAAAGWTRLGGGRDGGGRVEPVAVLCPAAFLGCRPIGSTGATVLVAPLVAGCTQLHAAGSRPRAGPRQGCCGSPLPAPSPPPSMPPPSPAGGQVPWPPHLL